MYFEEALTAELETIIDLFDKVFPANATQGINPPYLVYLSSEGVPDKAIKEGYLNIKEVSCELNIIHSDYPKMKELTRSVLAKIRSFQGREIGFDGPFIQNVAYEDPVEIYENEIDSYRCVLNITVKF